MKKLVVILIFILLLVFIFQLYASKPYGKEEGKAATTKKTKNVTAVDYFEKENGISSTTDEGLWPPPHAVARFPTIVIFQGNVRYNQQLPGSNGK